MIRSWPVAMSGTRRHDEAAIGFFCECGEGRLDVCCVAHASCCHCHPQRAGSCFGRVHKRDMGGYFRTVDERYSPHLRRDLVKHFNHFPPIAVSKFWKPVIFPPGCARFATKPPPTGSDTVVKTIGMVCVARRSIAAAGFAQTTIISGASAISSSVPTRIRSASWPVNR